MSSQVTFDRSPEQIEANIVSTRASLDRKLQDIEERLSPRARLNELRARVHPREYLGLAAVAAIATGTALAVRGFRRTRQHDAAIADWADEPLPEELEMAAIVCESE